MMDKNIIYQPKIKKLKIIDWIFIVGVLCFALAVMLFRPVPILPENKLMVMKGKVIEIYEGGVNDINFKLEGRKEIFYVNRGLERGLRLLELRARLINKNIIIKYPDHWSLLNFNKGIVHISKIEHEGRTIFTEIKL
jgi:hypothetical protein